MPSILKDDDWESSVNNHCSVKLSVFLETIKFYPYKAYCYHSIIESLKRLLLRPGFVNLCESTRKNFTDISCLCDVYHGQIWRDFLQFDGKELLALPLTYAFMMNIDWFEPFEHITYTVGVIYLALLNLPRSVRYKRENIILVGIIPGPAEPSLSMNTYQITFKSKDYISA